jgi:flagellar basal-body rod protein FlgC
MDTTPLVEWVQQEIPNQLRNVIYDPSHPDADANGFVTMPDVNILEEMADLMIASRAFDANVTVIDAAKSMITKSLSI